ncbi:AMP-binding enzyme [Ancylostoma duodenale]|uniref:AMP-binding enzyme n=1 Tax=Ancylostoma duodenale TaxID=51022 RepID=A0A0C2GCT7_9BILA|nr:AMP-binding enzyme [Ancylostoma duodenale]
MEIQNAFQIQWDKTPYPSFTDYFFTKISTHGSNLAIVDTDTGKQWRYSEIRGWCDMCCTRLRELQGCDIRQQSGGDHWDDGLAILTSNICPSRVLSNWLHSCSREWTESNEIWQLVDLSESTHLIVEQQFMQKDFLFKADDVRRKAAMRGGGRIKHVRLIDDVLTTDSISSEPKKRHPLLKEPSSAKMMWVYSCGTENGTEERCESPSDVPATINPNAGNNPMLIFFTSGTTGLPKAAEYSHRALIINIQQMSLPLYGPVQPRERFLLPLSISHIYGAVSAYYALVNGATINVSHITPTMIMWLAMDAALENTQVNSLRSMLVAGAPIDSNLANNAKRKLNLKDLRQSAFSYAYGMTELGGLCTLSHYECDKIETVGSPLPGMLFKVVNWETKQLCPPRTPGQLMVLGPQVMPSYYKNPKATSELLDSNGYVKTGPFHTGDAAFYDETGHIYVLDRIKDIVRYKGTLVCPSEVELMLRAHPGIDDCAVVGRQDHVSGETSRCSGALGKIATFKELRGGVFFVPEIPRSTCGKVLRRQLRQFWDRERTNSKDVITKDGKGQKANEKPDRTPVKRANGSATPTKRPVNRHIKK